MNAVVNGILGKVMTAGQEVLPNLMVGVAGTMFCGATMSFMQSSGHKELQSTARKKMPGFDDVLMADVNNMLLPLMDLHSLIAFAPRRRKTKTKRAFRDLVTSVVDLLKDAQNVHMATTADDANVFVEHLDYVCCCVDALLECSTAETETLDSLAPTARLSMGVAGTMNLPVDRKWQHAVLNLMEACETLATSAEDEASSQACARLGATHSFRKAGRDLLDTNKEVEMLTKERTSMGHQHVKRALPADPWQWSEDELFRHAQRKNSFLGSGGLWF